MVQIKSSALISLTIDNLPQHRQFAGTCLAIAGGVVFLALTAQLYIYLPFTPVPITGQTFGVALLALLWGRQKASLSFGAYLMTGAAGLPVFAMGSAYLSLGPTLGYLVGMFASTLIIGTLADRGIPKSFSTAFACCVCGSLAVFSFGLMGLSLFVPKTQLLELGLYPFLIGDFLKNSLAASLFLAISAKATRKKTQSF